MKKIKDMHGFVKDDKTGIIQNCNLTDLEMAKKAKKRILDEIRKTKELECRVSKLEDLLTRLIEKET
jgi:hypothetical protein